MSMESDNPLPETPVPVLPASNPGQILRQAREHKGISVAEVAEGLNLTGMAVQSLEAGHFERLPGHTFARGYIRAYAKLMGLDQAEMVEQFDRFTGTDAQGAEVRNLNRIHEPRRMSISKTILKLVTALLLLLLIALGYYVWQETPDNFGRLGALGLRHIEVEKANGTTEIHPIDEPPTNSVMLPLGTAPEQQSAEEPASTDMPGAAAGAESAADTAPVDASEPAQPQPLNLNTSSPTLPAGRVSLSGIDDLAARNAPATLLVPQGQPAQLAAAPAPELAPGQGLVEISFVSDCWLQVTDSNGRTAFSGVKRKGESLSVTAHMPVSVHLGNAAAAQVRFNGEPVSVGRVSSGGTARLTLGH